MSLVRRLQLNYNLCYILTINEYGTLFNFKNTNRNAGRSCPRSDSVYIWIHLHIPMQNLRYYILLLFITRHESINLTFNVYIRKNNRSSSSSVVNFRLGCLFHFHFQKKEESTLLSRNDIACSRKNIQRNCQLFNLHPIAIFNKFTHKDFGMPWTHWTAPGQNVNLECKSRNWSVLF